MLTRAKSNHVQAIFSSDLTPILPMSYLGIFREVLRYDGAVGIVTLL
jgi:hypothetical protein